MTNIAFKDIQGGCIHVYTANKNLPKWERLRLALLELDHMACITVYLIKGNKKRIISRKGYDSFKQSYNYSLN